MKRRIVRKFLYSSNLNKYLDPPAQCEITKILEAEYGHAKSREKKQCINKDDQPLPWFTYPAIEYLQQLDLKAKVVLEWGAGNSSLFFSTRVKVICSIEHDKDWYQNILARNISNQKLIFKQGNDYVEAIRDFNTKFDVIVIDGILREECAKISLEYMNDGALIILDNSDRDPQIAEFLRSSGLIEVDLSGFGPINDYTWTTSLFFTRNFNFSPLGRQPTIPLGGGF